MRFYNQNRLHFCGVDLHAKTMYLCILDRDGKTVLHRKMPAKPAPFLDAIEPFREKLVVGVECFFAWYWLADLCAEQKIEFILGHALYMKAIHGGKAKNDRIDSLKIASLMRGGTFPMAYVYPQKMRATRDLLRRRNYLTRKRAALLTQIQNTKTQYNLEDFPKDIAYKSNRVDLAEHFPDPDVKMSIIANLELIEHLEYQKKRLECYIVKKARHHDKIAVALLKTVPGIGRILSLNILYEIQDIKRFPRVQDFASYARLVKCSKESAGKYYGFSGSKIGNAHLKWAFSEAAVMFLSKNPAGQKYKRMLAKKHGKAKAMSILAHKIGRTVYYILKRREPFDMERFLA